MSKIIQNGVDSYIQYNLSKFQHVIVNPTHHAHELLHHSIKPKLTVFVASYSVTNI